MAIKIHIYALLFCFALLPAFTSAGSIINTTSAEATGGNSSAKVHVKNVVGEGGGSVKIDVKTVENGVVRTESLERNVKSGENIEVIVDASEGVEVDVTAPMSEASPRTKVKEDRKPSAAEAKKGKAESAFLRFLSKIFGMFHSILWDFTITNNKFL